MALPLMPKATAVWLVENTALSFKQIADFCGLHSLEVQAIADDEVAHGIVGQNPVFHNQLTHEEIARCEADPEAKLQIVSSEFNIVAKKTSTARYTPVSKRQDKPDAIAWVLKQYPQVSDLKICRLLGTTKSTIQMIKDKTHWNFANIKPRNPVILGLCSQADLEQVIDEK